MKRRLSILFFAVALVVSLAAGARSASAMVIISSVNFGCSVGFISGTSSNPIVVNGVKTVTVAYLTNGANGVAHPVVNADGSWQAYVQMNAPVADGSSVVFDVADADTGFASISGTCHIDQGPPIPAGFVLRTITCTTAVFDSVGGNPVPGAVITAGQTWYVNPKPVVGSKRSWTEIFVSGVNNGFIPTSCVSGY